MANDITSIEQVLTGYCHAIDRGTADDAIVAFHDDAVLMPVYEGNAVYQGKVAIRAWYENYVERMRAGLSLLRHKISTLHVRLDGDEARSVCYMDVDSITKETGRMVSVIGRYEDRLVKADGAWYLMERRILVDNTREVVQS